jgi:hypothetical protein
MKAETAKLLAIIFLTIAVFLYIIALKTLYIDDEGQYTKKITQGLILFSSIALLISSIFSMVYKSSQVDYNDILHFVSLLLTISVILILTFHDETKIHSSAFIMLISITIILCIQMVLNL